MKISQQFRSASFILAFSHIGSNAARIGASRQERKNDNNEGRDLASVKEYVRDETSSIVSGFYFRNKTVHENQRDISNHFLLFLLFSLLVDYEQNPH